MQGVDSICFDIRGIDALGINSDRNQYTTI